MSDIAQNAIHKTQFRPSNYKSNTKSTIHNSQFTWAFGPSIDSLLHIKLGRGAPEDGSIDYNLLVVVPDAHGKGPYDFKTEHVADVNMH